jgi:hypothetical protein
MRAPLSTIVRNLLSSKGSSRLFMSRIILGERYGKITNFEFDNKIYKIERVGTGGGEKVSVIHK